MTLATGIVLTSCSFLLGAQFIHWSVDHRTLWTNPISQITITNSLIYYTNLSNLIFQTTTDTNSHHHQTSYVFMVFKLISLIGLISLLSKLKNSSISVVFDVASLVLLITSIIVEIAHVMPLLKTLPKTPISFNPSDPLTITQSPTTFRSTSSIILTIQSIASLNTIISVTLTGLIALQIAQMCIEKSLYKSSMGSLDVQKKLVKVKGLDREKVLRINQRNGNGCNQNPLQIQSNRK